MTQIVPTAYHTLTEDTPELAAEPAPEEIVRHKVDGRVKDDEEVTGLIESVQWEALEHLCVLLERPDDSRNERRSLAEEENDDDPDEHDGGVISLALHCVDLLATATWQSHGVYETDVEHGEEDEGDAAHERDVEPRVVQLAEHVVAAEWRQVAAEARLVAHRYRNDHRLVLEELRDVEEHPDDVDREDDLACDPYVTERLRVERMADHDVAVNREGQGEPNGRHLEGEGQRMDEREQVGIQPTVPRPLLLVLHRIV